MSWTTLRASLLGFFFLLLSFNGYCLTDGYYKLTVKHTGKALTVQSNSTADAAHLVQYTYNGGDNQMWYVEKTSDTNPETYMLVSAKSQKVADVQGAYTSNGAYLLQYHYNGNNNQRYILEDLGTGYFKIKAKHSGKV